MRQHLLQCLEDGVMKQFPGRKRKCQRKMKGRKELSEGLYCRCRLQEDRAMVLCDICGDLVYLVKLAIGLHQTNISGNAALVIECCYICMICPIRFILCLSNFSL